MSLKRPNTALARSIFPGDRNRTWKYFLGSVLVVGTIGSIQNGLTMRENSILTLDSNPRRTVTPDEVKKHDSLEHGVWVAINQKVYDLTDFLGQHPGGPLIILKHAGHDVSTLFNKIHAKDTIANFLPKDAYVGDLVGELDELEDPQLEEDRQREKKRQLRPPLTTILNLKDFEYVAKQIIPLHAWAYYSGGSDDEVTLRENHSVYNRIFFKPKVLVDVGDVDISTTMLGVKTDAAFYCSAAALARLGNPDGEIPITEGCGEENIIQMISSASSCSFDEITDAAAPGQNQWFQLYAQLSPAHSFEMIKKCEQKGVKAIFVTVDTPLFGRREKDLRFKLDDSVGVDDLEDSFKNLKDFILSYQNVRLTWEEIREMKKATQIPIVIKGVQRSDDVLLAIENNVDAVVLSNHGGRQLDFSRAPLNVLMEVMPILRQKKLDDKIEVYIDGGIRRGSDVIKALCLGAKGVGLGRPFLYANSAYGKNGVIRACRLLKEEIARDMKLLGVSKISELGPELLDIEPQISDSTLFTSGLIYEPLYNPKFKELGV